MSPLIFQAKNSLVSQSKFSQKRKIPINADGFGLGWYPIQDDPIPATFVNVDPAWSNRNLKMICDKVQTHHYFAHVRDASIGMPVSQANCHPFQCMHYLWMHNGRLDLFDSFRRTLLNSLSDRAFSLIKGNTDSEYAFALFMDQLEFNPKASLIQLEVAMVSTIEKIMQIRKLCGANTNAFINFAVTDGFNTIATRFATLESAQPASLFYGTGSLSCIEGEVRITPTDDPSKMCMIVCSEPLTDDINIWKKVERNSLVSVTHDYQITQKPISLPYQTI